MSFSTPDSANSNPDALMQGPVLVIETDRDVRQMILAMLSRAGFEALGAASVREALAMCKRLDRTVRVLVAEQDLSEEEQSALVELIATLGPQLGLLRLGGGASAGTPNQQATAGPSIRRLPKPFSPTELVATVQSFFQV